MDSKPEALQVLEDAISRMSQAEATVRQSKAQVKECLLKLGNGTKEKQRLSIAKYLLSNFQGVAGIGRQAVARTLFGCSVPGLDRLLGPQKRNCVRCGAILQYCPHEIRIGDTRFFRSRSLSRGWACQTCAGIPSWMMQVRKLKDRRSRILRRFDERASLYLHVPFSFGEFTYSVGLDSLVRLPRIPDYGEPDYIEAAREMALHLEAHLATGDLGFFRMPKLPKIVVPKILGNDPWGAVFFAGNKRISAWDLYRIDGLPGLEIAPKITGPTEPMVFRFAYGAGTLMPLKPDAEMGSTCAFHLSSTEWVMEPNS